MSMPFLYGLARHRHRTGNHNPKHPRGTDLDGVPRQRLGLSIFAVDLRNNVAAVLHVVPNDEAIEVSAAGEKHAALGAFSKPVSKANILFAL